MPSVTKGKQFVKVFLIRLSLCTAEIHMAQHGISTMRVSNKALEERRDKDMARLIGRRGYKMRWSGSKSVASHGCGVPGSFLTVC